MYLTSQNNISESKEMITTFGGYNHNLRITDAEFYDMENLSSDGYPMLSTRPPRGKTELGAVYDMVRVNTHKYKASDPPVSACAVVRETENGGELALVRTDPDGEETLRPSIPLQDPRNTQLAVQSGYVYAFPDGVRMATFGALNAVERELACEITVTHPSENLIPPPTVSFRMEPCDAQGAAVSGAVSSRIATGIYTSGSNVYRGENQLIVVRGSGMTVNTHGWTVFVDSAGKITHREWAAYDSVPVEGKFTLTGHGSASAWLGSYCTEGRYVSFDEDTMTVRVYNSNSFMVVTDKPSDPVSGMIWRDTGTGAMYIYNSALGEWNNYITNYILFSFSLSLPPSNPNDAVNVTRNGKPVTISPSGVSGGTTVYDAIFGGFKEGDAVEISGISEEYDSTYVVAKWIGEKGLVLHGNISESVKKNLSKGEGISISRRMPQMDFVVESGNRLWGCYYGVRDGEVINEIYASALGDPTNWYRYQGISTDSWTATVGVDGAFTGAVVYGGYPLFFKENAIIRVYGTQPSSFQLATYNYRGVKPGSHKSLAVCDEVLYYHSCDGILAYSGAAPVKVDEALGQEIYHNAVAGELRGKYYVSMTDSKAMAHLFVYSPAKRMWHREDNLLVRSFCREGDQLYMACKDGVHTVMINADCVGREAPVKWFAESGEIGCEAPGKKYLKKLRLRAVLPAGSELQIFASYDDGDFVPCTCAVGYGITPIDVPFIPRRCDRFRLHLEGIGPCSILSIYKETESGEV